MAVSLLASQFWLSADMPHYVNVNEICDLYHAPTKICTINIFSEKIKADLSFI
jgi:hypothetical protein